MGNQLAFWVLVAWPPVVLALFRGLGARAGSAIAIVGGSLLLPRSAPRELFGPLTIDKRHVAGLALLAAALIFDRRRLAKFRPAWPDLAMGAFVLMPLVGCVAHRFEGFGPSIDQSFLNLAGWAIPYLVGRVYFGDARGPAFLAGVVVVAGLVYAPLCWFETLAGPGWYLSAVVYDLPYHEGVIDRLGGYRPEVFLGNGLELALWMALTAVIATWIVFEPRGERPARAPAWACAIGSLALIVTEAGCRGVFGYGILAIGLATTLATFATRSKIPLAVLVLVAPSYMVARGSGVWDGRELRQVARLGGREGTITLRLEAEDRLVGQTRALGLAFGQGGRAPYWESDSWWTSILKGGGAIGLATHYTAWMLPAVLVAFAPRRRFPASSTESGLALLVLLHAVDSLLNTSTLPSTHLIGGALVSRWLGGGLGVPEASASRRPLDRPNFPVAFIATVLVLIALEVVGRLPRSHRAVEAPTNPPSPGRGSESGTN